MTVKVVLEKEVSKCSQCIALQKYDISPDGRGGWMGHKCIKGAFNSTPDSLEKIHINCPFLPR